MGFDFTGKVVVVTGAGDGIGRAATLGFAAAGAQLVVCIDVRRAAETAAAITAAGGRAMAHTMDVRDGAGWATLVERVVGERGSIDVLVNNAGIAVPGDPAVDASGRGWRCSPRRSRSPSTPCWWPVTCAGPAPPRRTRGRRSGGGWAGPAPRATAPERLSGPPWPPPTRGPRRPS